MTGITLLEMNRLVKKALERSLTGSYWVKAEISSYQVNQGSGHCYLELIQKDDSDGNTVARAKANWWRSSFMRQSSWFEAQTGQRLKVGLKVQVQVSVSFHENYGYSLVIQDIDPTYTLGDMAMRRREILKKLEADGVLDLNRELEMPLLPQRIAVISSATAAGYGDFCRQLTDNPYGFRFELRLFAAAMQGEHAEESVIAALDRIAELRDTFDLVVIIRGGGAVSELACFDSYNLAFNVANFPLPVITGIGHERDETVIDLVAHTKVKTPTAAAQLLVAKVLEQATIVDELSQRLVSGVQRSMEAEHRRIDLLMQKIPSLFSVLKLRQEQKMERLYERASVSLERFFTAQKHKFELYERSLRAASPELILKRGYSLTTIDGHAVRSVAQIRAGQKITTRFADGCAESNIIDIQTIN